MQVCFHCVGSFRPILFRETHMQCSGWAFKLGITPVAKMPCVHHWKGQQRLYLHMRRLRSIKRKSYMYPRWKVRCFPGVKASREADGDEGGKVSQANAVQTQSLASIFSVFDRPMSHNTS